MDIGMLWYDDNPTRPLAEKVTRAAEFYFVKYKMQATTCYVHTSVLEAGKVEQVGVITVKGNKTVVKNHLWLGTETGPIPGEGI